MAKRPVFMTRKEFPYYEQVEIEFEYYTGFAVSQKQKSIKSLHDRFRELYEHNVLEISTKSTDALGISLSAFNLSMELEGSKRTIEAVFQGSKCFEKGGPYTDLYDISPREAKKDIRIRTSGKLVGFEFNNVRFGNEPKDFFYNWIYIQALYKNAEYKGKILEYGAFTDIEFNPQKSINCQAKAAAIAVGLMNANLIGCVEDTNKFLEIVYGVEKTRSYEQMSIFDLS